MNEKQPYLLLISSIEAGKCQSRRTLYNRYALESSLRVVPDSSRTAVRKPNRIQPVDSAALLSQCLNAYHSDQSGTSPAVATRLPRGYTRGSVERPASRSPSMSLKSCACIVVDIRSAISAWVVTSFPKFGAQSVRIVESVVFPPREAASRESLRIRTVAAGHASTNVEGYVSASIQHIPWHPVTAKVELIVRERASAEGSTGGERSIIGGEDEADDEQRPSKASSGFY